MENENIAFNSVLGLELNRVFFAIHDPANKREIIEFARGVLKRERAERARGASPEGPTS
jgi:hypothetical protein